MTVAATRCERHFFQGRLLSRCRVGEEEPVNGSAAALIVEVSNLTHGACRLRRLDMQLVAASKKPHVREFAAKNVVGVATRESLVEAARGVP